jgi:hypothetical protein
MKPKFCYKVEVVGSEFGAKMFLWSHFYIIINKFVLNSRYGGEEYLRAPQKELMLAQTSHYVEYTRYGTVVKVLNYF